MLSDCDALLTDEAFVELICADDEFVGAEFDAIIAAEWPTRPPAEPGRDDAVQPPARGGRPLPGPVRLTHRPQHPGIDGWARGRSPPVGRR